jgi:hypothetical protein
MAGRKGRKWYRSLLCGGQEDASDGQTPQGGDVAPPGRPRLRPHVGSLTRHTLPRSTSEPNEMRACEMKGSFVHSANLAARTRTRTQLMRDARPVRLLLRLGFSSSRVTRVSLPPPRTPTTDALKQRAPRPQHGTRDIAKHDEGQCTPRPETLLHVRCARDQAPLSLAGRALSSAHSRSSHQHATRVYLPRCCSHPPRVTASCNPSPSWLASAVRRGQTGPRSRAASAGSPMKPAHERCGQSSGGLRTKRSHTVGKVGCSRARARGEERKDPDCRARGLNHADVQMK